MESFITSQKELSKHIGITPEHLSCVLNNKHGISPELSKEMEKVTNIDHLLWLDRTKRRTIKKRLREFFKSQKEAKKNGITSTI